MKATIQRYTSYLQSALDEFDWSHVETFVEQLRQLWDCDGQLFICGNGGSASNANHATNDFIYGLNPRGRGIRTHSLSANNSVNSCLANDTGYQNVFAHQLRVLGQANDILIVFSGSGNSENVLKVIQEAKRMGITTAGVLGFDGGRAKNLLDHPIHFPVDDMQVSEDLQMMVVHMIVQHMRRGVDE